MYALCILPLPSKLIGDSPCWRMGGFGSNFWDVGLRVITATGTRVKGRSGCKDVIVQYASSILLALFLDSFGFLSFLPVHQVNIQTYYYLVSLLICPTTSTKT